VWTWTVKHSAKGRFANSALTQPNLSGVPQIVSTHRAMLIGDFHDVRPDTWRARIDGLDFDITSIDWAEGMFTLLEMQVRTPSSG
jgi:hypothetical protein